MRGKTVSCSSCSKLMRSDNLKRHTKICLEAKGFAPFTLKRHATGGEGNNSAHSRMVEKPDVIRQKRRLSPQLISDAGNKFTNQRPKNLKIEASVNAFNNNDTHPTSQKKLTAEPSTPEVEVLLKNYGKSDKFDGDNQEAIEKQNSIKSEKIEAFPTAKFNNDDAAKLQNNIPIKKFLPGKINDETTREVQISLQKLINSGNTTAKKEFISGMKKLYRRKVVIILFKNNLFFVDMQKS